MAFLADDHSERVGRTALVGAFVHGIQACEGHVHRAVNWRAGPRQDTGDLERMMLVQRKTDIAGAVGDHDRIARPILQSVGNVGAQHCIVLIAEAIALCQYQSAIACEAKVLEVIGRRAEHAVTAMRIALPIWNTE